MASLEEKEIHVKQLKLGMFVSRLDIPWEMTRFPLQGLYIQSREDIERLAECCEFVVIDHTRARERATFDAPPMAHVEARPSLAAAPKPATAPQKKLRNHWKRKHCVENYKITANIRNELSTSKNLLDTMERQIYLICEHTLRCRRANIEQLIDSTTQVVESVIRNPDAMAWLCRVRATRKPIYMHTIRLAVWGAIVGRQLGLNRFTLTHLCSALLMTGIGKSRVSEKALSGYSPQKPSEEYQAHLKETLYQLQQMHNNSDDLVNTISRYCERIDGSGYPNKISGDSIPFLSQVAGLVETYELLINPYHCTRAVSPANAIVYLNKCKDKLFETTLVEEFIKAIGIYPTGTVVELSNGEMGVVVSQNYERRLRASVIPVLGVQGDILKKYKVLDLSYANNRDGTAERVCIRRGVPSTVVPRGLLEETHNWIFNRSNPFGFFQQNI
ncbi:HD-GYP domain-containing protein (c-di-GMP phosphodiesterase class II) [Alteromonadaceae bacterium 2753L.S.0a.02]|nr:HD-GYP domain-containing protein (c-di-GMP phosphodiesterase class II) [Alteromonadaceae bacterium 2753L.S.0a.02]